MDSVQDLVDAVEAEEPVKMGMAMKAARQAGVSTKDVRALFRAGDMEQIVTLVTEDVDL